MAHHFTSYNLDHLGLVAGMIDELGWVSLIDTLIPQDYRQRKVIVGLGVKAMILNGLCFVNRALYLMPHFFQDKPVERLLGQGMLAEYFNDDVLGRILEPVYKGCNFLTACLKSPIRAIWPIYPASSQIPPAKPEACKYEPLKAG